MSRFEWACKEVVGVFGTLVESILYSRSSICSSIQTARVKPVSDLLNLTNAKHKQREAQVFLASSRWKINTEFLLVFLEDSSFKSGIRCSEKLSSIFF